MKTIDIINQKVEKNGHIQAVYKGEYNGKLVIPKERDSKYMFMFETDYGFKMSVALSEKGTHPRLEFLNQ
jgi:hypothetical protein